jgi:acetyl-CoA carboxylase carboxyltransferase component
MEHTFPGESEPTRAIIPNEEFEHSLKDADYSPPEEAWQKLDELYRDLDRLDRKRQARRSRGKVYVYDRPALIEGELEKIWGESGMAKPDNIFSANELILDRSCHLVPIERAPERSILSIVVWKVHIKTPEAPKGRNIVIVSGDMTIRGGSVAIREDMTYAAASELATAEGIPFVYFAEGSGARIGLDRLVSHSLNYDDESDELYLSASDYKLLKPLVMARPRIGGKTGGEESYVVTSIIGGVPGIRADIDGEYLYLTEPDYRIHGDNVEAHERKVIINGTEQRRWVISSIIKSSPELNQENLSGSARTARASSMAFHSVPTMAIITDTCTGIISYNVRLLKRVIQTRQSEIILTGYRALNALYGGEKIFSSNRELGGPEIMGPNGVSHRIAEDERDACRLLLRWIRGLPPVVGKKTPSIRCDDTIERDIGEALIGPNGLISPPAPDAERPKSYDGLRLAEILFDSGSAEEEMAEWGGGVRVGRATMGGLPIGFIAVETGTSIKHVPADPADPDTATKDKMEFGQVWYPDSAFKTAQWIEFMRRERRPLVIMPNWRGFAGGKLELFEEVLKYGAMIVDELSKYDLPVVLYMPPYAEIRGGAWVVVDSQINPDHIKFLVDEHATGSVLEPSGMESVPLVEREIRKDMRKNDPALAKLYDERKRYPGQLDRVRDIDEKLDEREKELYPKYVKKWIRIFRKHNTAERMKIVGTAHEVVSTGKARERIYNALVEGLEKVEWE